MKKSLFRTIQIRELSASEMKNITKIDMVLKGKRKKAVVAIVPALVSEDNKPRPLILHKEIVRKIQNDHGNIILENLIINANEWDYVIKNVNGNKDKINLIKIIPHTPYFLTIGANRFNGFFTVTHYESRPKTEKTLKNLLHNKGDSLIHIERTALPHLQLSHNETASQLGLSGVNVN